MRLRTLGVAIALAVIGHVTTAHAAGAGPVAAYNFDDTNGTTAADATGHGHTATVASASWTTTGKYQGAVALNGTSSLISVPDASDLDLSAAATIEAWVRPSALSGDRTIVAKTRAGGGFPYGLQLRGRGVDGYGTVGGSSIDATGGRVATGSWYFVAMTFDGSTLRTYLNGSQVASKPASGRLSTSSGPVQLGGDSQWGEYLKGSLDNVRIYDRVLSSSELASDRGTAIPAASAPAPTPIPTPTPTPPPPAPPPPSGGSSANVWMAPGGGSCARQSSPAGFVAAQACGSFQSALNAAQPGDVVLARCTSGSSCTFPPETLSSAKGSDSSRISIAAASGYTVSFSGPSGSGNPVWLRELHNVDLTDIGFGTNNVGNGSNFDGNLRIDCSSNVTLKNATGRRFHMFEGNTNLTFSGGSWGNYANPGEEDSSIGTTQADRPGETCNGDSAPKPSSYITFDGVKFHDVFANTASSQWGSAHPDCFEVNGYTDHLTIENSEFANCGNTFFSLYGNQGYDTNVTFRNNNLHDLNDNPGSEEWYGVQIHSNPNSGSTPNGGRLGNVVVSGNTVTPNNPDAPGPYSGFYITEDVASGMQPIKITGNTLSIIQPPTECAHSQAAPTLATWSGNTWLRGTPCGT